VSKKGLKDEIRGIRDRLNNTPLRDGDVKKQLRKSHWDTNKTVWENRRSAYDGFKNGVALESVGEGSKIDSTSALIRIEVGYRQGIVKVGVLFVPRDREGRADRPRGKRRFDRAIDLASRLQEIGILTAPVSIFGVDTRKTRKMP
jgi:hypothetical protein